MHQYDESQSATLVLRFSGARQTGGDGSTGRRFACVVVPRRCLCAATRRQRSKPTRRSCGSAPCRQRATDIRRPPNALPDSIAIGAPLTAPSEVVEDEITDNGGRMEVTPVDTVAVLPDSIAVKEDEWVPREFEFNPNPTKATWMSALFPGLGQIYNRRYWKLPIIVGGYLGLAYATNWNNSMLRDYTRAYADLLDNDPNTRSYMDMFAPNVKEENLDRAWLQNVLRSRKNYFRRNRDLCIISMVGVYLLAMVDAYVDASLSHFDITPDLSMDVVPALMQDGRQRYPSVGLVWALNF